MFDCKLVAQSGGIPSESLRLNRNYKGDSETRALDAQALVDEAEDLIDLRNRLNKLTPEELMEVDMSSLPTFGGEVPDDMEGVLSWDETDLLVIDGRGDWHIVARSIWFEKERFVWFCGSDVVDMDKGVGGLLSGDLEKGSGLISFGWLPPIETRFSIDRDPDRPDAIFFMARTRGDYKAGWHEYL